MKTIVIPGYSHKNKEWADETAKNIPDVEVYDLKHWSDPAIKFSAKDEAESIASWAGKGGVNVVAKSIGTLIASIIIGKKSLRLGKVVFCGIPVNDLNEDELHEYKILNDFPPDKIIVFQNSEDEHGSFEAVRKFLSQYNPSIKIVEKLGKTHDYPYYEEMAEFLES